MKLFYVNVTHPTHVSILNVDLWVFHRTPCLPEYSLRLSFARNIGYQVFRTLVFPWKFNMCVNVLELKAM